MKKLLLLGALLITAVNLTAEPAHKPKVVRVSVEPLGDTMFYTWTGLHEGRVYRLETSFDGLNWQDVSGDFEYQDYFNGFYQGQWDLLPGQTLFVRMVWVR